MDSRSAAPKGGTAAEDPDERSILDLAVERRSAAIALAAEGFVIVEALEGHKEPLGREWQRLGVTDPGDITTILSRPGRQFGVFPPKGSRLFVIDFDDLVVFERFEHLLPVTLRVRTSKGWHVYLRLPERADEADVVRSFAGGEVRIAGSGQVVGPWGKHPSGAVYEPQGPITVGTASLELIEALRASKAAKSGAQNAAHGPEDDGWTVTEPGRHDFLLSRGRYMRGIGVSGSALRDSLHRLNRERCSPPKTDAEVESLADWIEDKITDDPPEPFALPRKTASASASDKSLGTRTAADLPYGLPPPQLVGEFLTPEGPTFLYGPGGVGKGITACYFALQLVREGHVVMIVDYEGHEREWGSRLRGLGATEGELRRVHYRAPFGEDWTAKTGALTDVADAVRDDAARLGTTYLVVDSYSVATSSGDALGGQEAAKEYANALTRIGLPSLTIAHVTGNADKWPARPFGSVFVHNLARETWAVERINKAEAEEDDRQVARVVGVKPHTVELEFRNRKSNGRAGAGAQFITFEFFEDGSITVNEGRVAAPSAADRAYDVLDAPMTLKQIVGAIREDTGEKVDEYSVLRGMKRQSDRFVVEKSARPAKWSRKR